MAGGSDKPGRGARPKHVPQRMCVACRRNDAKRGLIRVVRAPSAGRVMVDATGRQGGRGAYLCADPRCWELALRRHALERALRVEVLHAEDRAAILAFAAGLTPTEVAAQDG